MIQPKYGPKKFKKPKGGTSQGNFQRSDNVEKSEIVTHLLEWGNKLQTENKRLKKERN